MTDTQASLDSFDEPTGSSTSDDTSTEPEDTTTEPENNDGELERESLPSQSELPPQTVWDHDNVFTLDGVRVIPARNPDSFVSLPGDATGVYKHEVNVLLDDVSDYLETFDCHSVTVPAYYSDFEDMEPVVTNITAGVDTGAKGINGRHLENVVRYIAMKGGFKHSELNVYAGPGEHFLLTYEGNAFVVGTTEVTPPETSSYSPGTVSVKSFTIPEDDPRIQNGLSAFVNALEATYGYIVTDYVEHDGGKHVFRVEGDRDISIRGHHLQRLDRCVTDPTKLYGDRSIETEFDETFNVTISSDDFEHAIGDEIWGGCVVGYSWSVEDPRTSSRASLSGRIKVSVTYYYLLEREDHNRFEVRTKHDTIKRFKPENKDYNPLETP